MQRVAATSPLGIKPRAVAPDVTARAHSLSLQVHAHHQVSQGDEARQDADAQAGAAGGVGAEEDSLRFPDRNALVYPDHA